MHQKIKLFSDNVKFLSILMRFRVDIDKNISNLRKLLAKTPRFID